MKKQLNYTLCALLLVALVGFTGCRKDTPESTSKTVIKNSALAAVLKSKGFTIEGNMLVMDEKARSTTSLDLSGTKLTDISGLEIFPNLTEVNLADNGLGPTFDFAPLPQTIKSVSLAGNEIYDYLNLADTDYDKGEYKLIRPLDKLTLPPTAKYNMDALPAFAKTATKCDMQMQSCGNLCKLEKYTTLREVPDPVLLAYLKEIFPGKFDGDKIDITKRFKLTEAFTQLKIMRGTGWFSDPKFAELKNMEGIEYIVNDSEYAGSIMLYFNNKEIKSIPYLKPGKKLQTLFLVYVNTSVLNMSNAESLYQFASYHNKNLKSVNLSASKKILQRGENGHDNLSGDLLALVNCPSLIEIILPELSNTKPPISILGIDLIELPLLKSIDITRVQVFNRIFLGGISQCKIKYPTNIMYFTTRGTKADDGTLNFSVTEDVFDKEETVNFINKYKNKNKLTTRTIDFDIFPDIQITPYNYLTISNSRSNSLLKELETTTVASLIQIFTKTTPERLK